MAPCDMAHDSCIAHGSRRTLSSTSLSPDLPSLSARYSPLASSWAPYVMAASRAIAASLADKQLAYRHCWAGTHTATDMVRRRLLKEGGRQTDGWEPSHPASLATCSILHPRCHDSAPDRLQTPGNYQSWPIVTFAGPLRAQSHGGACCRRSAQMKPSLGAARLLSNHRESPNPVRHAASIFCTRARLSVDA
jgi:hypothetical protein